jgi:hypothetical protein
VSIETPNQKSLSALHDALIHSIRSDGGLLTISGAAGVHNWKMKVDSVKYLACSPFLSGNIILNVNLHKFSSEIRRYLSVSDELISLFFDVYGPKAADTSFDGLDLLEITSSYGV